MINIVTVHWQTSKWVDVQLRYLERNMGSPFRVFASLNGIDDPAVFKRFYFAEDLPGSHYEKLDALGRIVIEHSAPSDVLVFLDGDAFPVRPLSGWGEQVLSLHPLAAVRRDENPGDREPHASFCMTTCSFWSEIEGDWSRYGRPLRRRLEAAGIDWLPLLRTNTRDLHPLWFGIYAHRIYHHGAGFRQRVSKVDERGVPGLARARPRTGASLGGLVGVLREDPSRIRDVRPRHARTVGRALVKTGRILQKQRFAKNAEPLAEQVFSRLSSDPEFYLELDDSEL